METTVCIPDTLFAAGEEFASQIGVSRSELYTAALVAYLGPYYPEEIGKQLDRVYEAVDSALDEDVMLLQSLSLPKEEW